MNYNHPFGMMMSGRKFSASDSYRYGFNGKENQDDILNESYDLGLRIYDSRIGRMFSIDPLANQYSWQSPYAYHRNNPVTIIDYLGGGDPPTKPERNSATVKSGESLWVIAKKELGEKASNSQIQARVNQLIEINKLNEEGLIHKGQTIYLESEDVFNSRLQQYSKEKQIYDRKSFVAIPKPAGDPRNKYEPRPGDYIDKEGNFFQNASRLDELLHASVIGADVTNIRGGLRDGLINSINDYNDPDGVDFYAKMAAQLRGSGQQYIFINQMQVRFGPVSKGKAYLKLATYTMRNAQARIWVSYNANGTIKIEVNVWDYFDVRSQGDKDKTYNNWAEVLHPVHSATGSNTNMQTRSQWSKIVN